jgi:hypothetical protein
MIVNKDDHLVKMRSGNIHASCHTASATSTTSSTKCSIRCHLRAFWYPKQRRVQDTDLTSMKPGHARTLVGHLTRQRSTSLTCDHCTSRCPPSRSPRRCPHHSATASETSRASGPNPAPDADFDKDSAELRALQSDYIEDMARNYVNDFSDPSSKEDEAVRTHRLSSSEECESVRLHNEDEAPCPRDRGSPTTTPCSTLKYIQALHPLELSRSSSSPITVLTD